MFVVCTAYQTVAGVNGPLVILDKVKVLDFCIIYYRSYMSDFDCVFSKHNASERGTTAVCLQIAYKIKNNIKYFHVNGNYNLAMSTQ